MNHWYVALCLTALRRTPISLGVRRRLGHSSSVPVRGEMRKWREIMDFWYLTFSNASACDSGTSCIESSCGGTHSGREKYFCFSAGLPSKATLSVQTSTVSPSLYYRTVCFFFYLWKCSTLHTHVTVYFVIKDVTLSTLYYSEKEE